MTEPTPIRITLSGDLGSGKSSVGRRLAAALGVPYFSAGAMFRNLGHIQNLDALNTNLAAENNTDIDFAVDERTREIDRTVPSFVIDSRMAWHFVGNATKVFLSVSRDTAATRILGDGARGAGESYANHTAAVAAIGERRQSETRRYQRLYGVDITAPDHFDFVVITDDAAIDDVVDLVLATARGSVRDKFWLPRTRLVPMIAWESPEAATVATAAPLPLVVVHNFGFYSGEFTPLAAAVSTGRPFVAYRPETPRDDGDAVMARARRALTPGGLGRWVERAGIGRAFGGLLMPARP